MLSPRTDTGKLNSLAKGRFGSKRRARELIALTVVTQMPAIKGQHAGDHTRIPKIQAPFKPGKPPLNGIF
jgi:hypothetical protein